MCRNSRRLNNSEFLVPLYHSWWQPVHVCCVLVKSGALALLCYEFRPPINWWLEVALFYFTAIAVLSGAAFGVFTVMPANVCLLYNSKWDVDCSCIASPRAPALGLITCCVFGRQRVTIN